jgi:uncharacterized membrane protein
MKVQESIDISRPAAEVWQIVGSYENDGQWRGEVLRVSSQPSGPVQTGTEVVELAKFMGLTLKTPGQVAEVAGHSFRWRTGGGLQFTGRRLVEDSAPGRSRVTLTIEGRFAGLMLPLRAFEPLIEATMRRQITANLLRLRKLMEDQMEVRGGTALQASD